ncbi:PLP-dependent aminotransferase family protein [Sporichthya polymorpha]|uniref:aminotransferase-like domain-containing protein n=1 Tax=Sporichthya polymorpha TaxID=35751 RepID=UPI000362387C|nr:PLP-dependent aminotransferase family protein [Sporichthya polymorpha]
MDLHTNPAELARLLSGWTDGGHGTLPQRLAYGLRCAINSGLIPDGVKLPPERDLARGLAVSRSTVTTALDLLREDGLVTSRQGSGTVVRGPSQRHLGSARIAGTIGGASGIDLAMASPPDPSHLPPVTVDVGELICSRIGTGLVPLGLPVLREALAERHMQTGLITDPSQIHVTAGAHQAIALTFAAAAGPGDLAAVEEPNYSGIFDILDGVGARPLTLDSDEDGVRPASLDRALRAGAVAVYLQTGPQNPTGHLPSPERMQSLAAVADNHRAFVIEDVTLADLAYGGRVRPELAELCRRATVVTTGSFSKVGWAGLRIGWLRAPAPIVDRTLHLKLARDLGASAPSQLMAAALVPSLDDIAAHRQATLQEATSAALAQLATELPSWEITPPRGGSVLWAKLPVTDSNPFVALAGRHGVHVAPGSAAMAGNGQSPYIRICVDRPRPMVEAGLQRLLQAWNEVEAPRSRSILT